MTNEMQTVPAVAVAAELCDTEFPDSERYTEVAAVVIPRAAKVPSIAYEATTSIWRTFNAETGSYVSKLYHAA